MVDPKWESQLDPVMASAVSFLCHSLSDNILDKLLSKKCLTSSQHGEIDRLRQSRDEKHAARELFQVLRRGPAPSFDTFCGVLREVEGGEDLLTCLTQVQPRDHGSMAETTSTISGTSSRASSSESRPKRSDFRASEWRKRRWGPYHSDSKMDVQSDSGSTVGGRDSSSENSQQKPRLPSSDALGTIQVPTFNKEFEDARIGNQQTFSFARLFTEVHERVKSLNSPSMHFQRDGTALFECLDRDRDTVSNLSCQHSSILNTACLLEEQEKDNYAQQKIALVESTVKTDLLLKSLHEHQTTATRTVETAKTLAFKLKAKLSLAAAKQKKRSFGHEEIMTGINNEDTQEILADDFSQFLVGWQRLDHQQIESILKSGGYTPAFTLAVNAGRTIFIYNPPDQLKDMLRVFSKLWRWTEPPTPTLSWMKPFTKEKKKGASSIAGGKISRRGATLRGIQSSVEGQMFVYFHKADAVSATALPQKKRIHILLTATSAKITDLRKVLDKHFFTFDTTFNKRPGRLWLGRTTQRLLNGPSANGKDDCFSLECELVGDDAKGVVFYVSSKELLDRYLTWSSNLATFVFEEPSSQADKKANFGFRFYQTAEARIEMQWLGQEPKFVAYSDSTTLISVDRPPDRKLERGRTSFTIGIANDANDHGGKEEEAEWKRSSPKQSGPISRRIEVPSQFMGFIIGKGRRGLLQVEEATGASLFTKKQDRTGIYVESESMDKIKKAEMEIKRKITIAKVNIASGVKTEVREIAVGRPISGGLPLTPYGKDGGKITYRLTGVAPSPPVIHYKGYGLEKLWTSASDVLKKTENDPSVKATEIWFHLGSLEIRNLPPDDEATGYFTVSMAQKKLTSKPRIAWPSRFDNGIDKEMFTKLAAYLAKKANLMQSFVRHDMQFYTPSGSERRFRIWEPMSASYLLRGKNVLGQYTGNETVIGSGLTKAGRGLLFTRLSNQMRGEILMPDLPFDCRLLIQTDSLTHQTPEDEFETEELGWVLAFAEVDGMDLRLPELPDDYMLHYQRTSKRDCYTLENCTIVLAEESEILNVQQKEETKPKYDVRVHNSELDEILTSKSLVTSPPPDDKLANLLHETFKFVAKIGILSVS